MAVKSLCILSRLICCIVFLFSSTAWTASFGRSRPLSHLSPVTNITIDSSDGHVDANKALTISISIPATRKYHNIQRRWWALSDPNKSGFLSSLEFRTDISRTSWDPVYDSFGIPSEKLFTFLTKNYTTHGAEYPRDSLDFRLVLTPNEQLFDIPCYTLNADGSLSQQKTLTRRSEFEAGDRVLPLALRGEAYRKAYFVDSQTGELKPQWLSVGWARVTVEQDGESPIVQGSWKVDDEENLGVPSSIYHINTYDSMTRMLGQEFESERDLLDKVETSPLMVWRDADLKTIQYDSLDIDDGDMNFFLKSSTIEKRSVEIADDNTMPSGMLYEEYGKSFGFHKRSNMDNDTGNSGFSSGVNLASTVGNTDGCPSPRKVALMGIAADCNFLQQFNSTSSANSHIISIVNSASHAFESSFNITLGLSKIILVNSSDCPASPDAAPEEQKWNYACDSSNDISQRLGRFSDWRSQQPDSFATWSLLTNCAQGGVVGLSWLGMACSAQTQSSSPNGSVVTGANVISHTTLDWRVLAHELGHSFGAVHDCTSETCGEDLQSKSQCCPLSQGTCNADGKFIMNPSSGDSQDSFSACTQGNVCGALGRNAVNSTCLTSNTGLRLVTANECGNGIVEEGEECDCGGEIGCKNNSCCDPKTCKLTSGSQCDDSSDSCCKGCKFASTDTVCRASNGPCDPAEYCPGNSTACPSDVRRPDGEKCTQSNSTATDLQCISGHCTSRDEQCKTLLDNGPYTFNGQQINASRACDHDRSCQVSCMDPRFGSTCFTTSQNFLDGTPCGNGGKCKGGRCANQKAPLGSGQFGEGWIDDHRNVIIAVVCAVGGVVLLAIIIGFLRSVGRRRRAMSAFKTQRPNVGPPPGPPPGPPGPSHSNYGYNNAAPAYPPPAFKDMGPQYSTNPWRSSMNYQTTQVPQGAPPLPHRQYG